ncbi:MAG: 4Fe-4S binding protein [Eubacteriales bacterium]|nr:4Fe-4S binding protein [Eubacteriales bacterium]
MLKKYSSPLIMWCIFEAIAIILWQALDNIFYLFNFTYIGTSIAAGLILYIKKNPYARNVVQFAVGLYMLVYLGFLSRENMQIEGFWYYLFLGVFEAATIHYAVAKIFGPLVFGRGWCGYACWTAMILDLLPFKKPQAARKNWGFIRYLVFAASLGFVAALFIFKVNNIEQIMWWSFIAGNILYYAVGITLAYICKDNRAFCKYICPVTVFLKPMSYFARFRVTVDSSKCISCGKCERICPMNVEVTNNSRKRTNGTECILCMYCIDNCPVKAIKL